MASGLQNLSSVFTQQVNDGVSEGVDFIEDIYASGFVVNVQGTNFLGVEGSTYNNPGLLGEIDTAVNTIEDIHGFGFVKGLQAGDDTLFVGAGGENYTNPGPNFGVFYLDDYQNGPPTNGINFTKNRQPKDPTEYDGVSGDNFNHPEPDEQSQEESNQWLDIFDHKFTPNRKHLDPSEFKGASGTNYTNPGEFVGLFYYESYDDAGLGADYIDNIHATGFTKLRQHKEPSEFSMVAGDLIDTSNDNPETGTIFRQFGNSVFAFGGEQKNKYLSNPGNTFVFDEAIDPDKVSTIQRGGVRSVSNTGMIQTSEVTALTLKQIWEQHINDIIDFEKVESKIDGRLTMRYQNGRYTSNGFLPFHYDRNGGGDSDEPYIVKPIGGDNSYVQQHQDDEERLGKYLFDSQNGIQFIQAQNLIGFLAYDYARSVKHGSVYSNSYGKFDKQYDDFGVGQQLFQYVYNPLSAFSTSVPYLKLRFNRSFFFDEQKYLDRVPGFLGDLVPNDPPDVQFPGDVNTRNGRGPKLREQKLDDYKERTTLGGSIVRNVNNSIDGTTVQNQGITGDFHTTAPITDAVTLAETKKGAKQLDSMEEGYPFYFKDMRNNRILMFRGYIKDLTENIAPTYSTENYIGRSEPVVAYQSTTRGINFSLDLYANNFSELQYIYQKLDYLTSMMYPSYADEAFYSGEIPLIRPKPPLCRMRLADLYGGGPAAQADNPELKHGMLGYINSLSYNFNEEGTWHYMDEVNRVPKFITANIEFQVIHDQTANINTRFYGMEYNKQTLNNQEGLMFDTYGKSYSDEAIPYSQPDDA